MTDAYIYDAIRTPRGKGRKDGALHEVTAARLSACSILAKVCTAASRLSKSTSDIGRRALTASKVSVARPASRSRK